MIRYDEKTRTLFVSVHDLLSTPLVPVTREGLGGALRMRAGSLVHTDTQGDESPDQVRTEVSVSESFLHRNLTVRLEGRIDRVRQSPAIVGVEVEEIKSLLLPGVGVQAWALDPAHAEQVLFYALLLHRADTPIRACRVIYIEATDGTTRAFDVPFEPEHVSRLVLDRLDVLIDEVEQDAEHRRRRRALAGTMPFPHAGLRESQRVLVYDIGTACAAGRTMMCSAPTGIGKTAAALFPVVKHALETDGLVFFLTSRISQQELALRTLAAMLPPHGGALAVQITAKERSCPFPDWQCVAGRCPQIDNFHARLIASGLEDKLIHKAVLTGEVITQAALEADLCPFETTLALARKATVIVADYNYVFHPGVTLKMLMEIRDRPIDLIVDEAHNLPSRVADFYSPKLDVAAMDRIATVCLGTDSEALRDAGKMLDSICRHQRAAWGGMREENGEILSFTAEIDRCYFKDIQASLDTCLTSCFLALAGRPPLFPREQLRRGDGGRLSQDPLLETLFTLRTFCSCAACDPALFASLWEKDGLRLLCLNPAVFILQQSNRFAFTLYMSATLTPFAYYARMLGVEPNVSVTVELASPFPRENRLILAVPTVDTSFRARDRDAAAIASIITQTIQLRKGNYLAFFTSFTFRDLVASRFPAGDFDVIIQKPAMKTETVLKRLKENTNGTVILCGVQGGVFAEGVDYPGHLAIGAFIVGPGLPMVCPELKLLEHYYESHDGKGKGFELAYVTPGVVRAVQAGGRVIRSETDRGFVMLLGKRFQSKLYREKLPEYWRHELLETEDPVARVNEFWSQPQTR